LQAVRTQDGLQTHPAKKKTAGQDGAVVLAGSGDELKVNRWDLQTGQRQRCFTGFMQRYPQVEKSVVTPDGCGIFTLSHRDESRWRDRTDVLGNVLDALSGNTAPVAPVMGAAVRSVWLEVKTANKVANAMQYPFAGDGYYLEFWEAVSETGVQAVSLGPDPPPRPRVFRGRPSRPGGVR
jgi:hypothetical protein